MASAPPDPGGGMGTPVTQVVSAANRFLRRLSAVSTPPMNTRSHISPPPSSNRNSLRPALITSEPIHTRPEATNFISPTTSSLSARSRQSTDPEGSTGDEAVASLRAYAMIADKAIEAEINAINELEVIDENPSHTEDEVNPMTPLKKLDPIACSIDINPKTPISK